MTMLRFVKCPLPLCRGPDSSYILHQHEFFLNLHIIFSSSVKMKIEKKIDQESQSICTLNSIEENRV